MKRILALLLLVTCAMLPLLAACSTAEQPAETTQPETSEPAQTTFTLADKKESYYRIVRADDESTVGYDMFRSSASTLKRRIRDEFGIEMKLVTDYVSEYQNDRAEKEIIIGTVQGFGQDYTYDREALGMYGYSITVQGEKITVAAATQLGFNEALEALFTSVLRMEGETLIAEIPAPIGCTNEEYLQMKGEDELFEIADKDGLFGICYSMWFNLMMQTDGGEGIAPAQIFNIEEILAGKANWGHPTAFHYWSKPAQGYYNSTSATAAANNMKLLGEAGVDFVILDYTFIQDFDTPGSDRWNRCIGNAVPVLLNAVKARLEQGLPSPRVVFWTADRSQWDALYEHFYSKEKWEDCFVYWNGKPFIMEWTFQGDNHALFTCRGQAGLVRSKQKNGQWSYLEPNNAATINKGVDLFGNKIVEHMPVCVATQETYMSEPTAHGRNHGIFWYTQWVKAFENKPKIITLTWWNEWGAQRLEVDGTYRFVDNYNMEYSRDIEPMEGGHGDQYYRWMIEYIRAYRAGEDCPVLVEEGFEAAARKAAGI